MRLIVLAAGFATRLWPLTKDCAKPLLDIAGRPLLSRLLDRVLALDCLDRVLVVTNARFHDDFVGWQAGFASPVPVELLDDGAVDDASKLGAVADLALATRRLAPGEDCLVVAGDNLLELDLDSFIARYKELAAPLTLVEAYGGPVPPARYGEAIVGADGRLIRFREKPRSPESQLVGKCLYAFPAGIDRDVRAFLAADGPSDAPGYFIAGLCRDREVWAMQVEGRVFDIGTPASLAATRACFEQID